MGSFGRRGFLGKEVGGGTMKRVGLKSGLKNGLKNGLKDGFKDGFENEIERR